MVSQCRLIQLRQFRDRRGNLSVVESLVDVPFEIKRVFFLYDVPSGESRGAHAHRELQQVLVCLGGSFSVETNNGVQTQRFELNRPWLALLIPPWVWASEVDFSPGSTCLVLCSDVYRESDYIRDIEVFNLEIKNSISANRK
jgi:hypothetical protein